MSESLTQTAKILRLLKTNGSATNRELNRLAFRYSARIKDLRDSGHDILTERIKEGLFRYTYKGHIFDGHNEMARGRTHHDDRQCCPCPCRQEPTTHITETKKGA